VIFSGIGQETLVHDFDDVDSASGLLAAAPYLNSETATANAYRFVFDTLINVSNVSAIGRRPGVPLVIQTLTDGFPSDAGEGDLLFRDCGLLRRAEVGLWAALMGLLVCRLAGVLQQRWRASGLWLWSNGADDRCRATGRR